MKKNNSDFVFSTTESSNCPECFQPIANCICTKKAADTATSKSDVVRVCMSTKGRKGKGVSVVEGLTLPQKQLKDLAKKLKQKCGTGGTAKDGVIEIQGDQRDILVEMLKKMGYKDTKKSGG